MVMPLRFPSFSLGGSRLLAARSRQDAFPVIGPDGELTGIVRTGQVDDVPAHEWVSRLLE